MATFRLQRINKQIQREISLLLELRIKNETAKLAVITGVNCTRDLSYASVYFTTVDKDVRKDVLNALTKLSGSLRGMLGKDLHLRQIPELNFKIDTSEEYGREIDKILDSIQENKLSEKMTSEQGQDTAAENDI